MSSTLEAFLRAARAVYGRDKWTAKHLLTAARKRGKAANDRLRESVFAVVGRMGSGRAFAQWLGKHRDCAHGESGLTLAAEYDTNKKRWVYWIAARTDRRTRDERVPRPKVRTRKEVDELAKATGRVARAEESLKRTKAELRTTRDDLIYAQTGLPAPAERRVFTPDVPERVEPAPVPRSDIERRIAHAKQEAAKAELLASDPAPSEVWCGPYHMRGTAEEAAARIKKHGLGCASVIEEIGDALYARSVGAREAVRIADALRRIYRDDQTARVGLTNTAPTREMLVAASLARVADDRQERAALRVTK